MDELQVRRSVRDRYGAAPGEDCCGSAGEGACCDGSASGTALPMAGSQAIPKIGLGDPVARANPQPGEIVLDLGSGPGRDVIRAAELVGPSGRAIGVDATPEMIFRSRNHAQSLGRTNAEFRLGEIEHLPVDASSVDVVVSDCVINLSPDKAQVVREAHRVMKPGGRLVVLDILADKDVSASVREDPDRWAACEAGAVTRAEIEGHLRDAGFTDIGVRKVGSYKPGISVAWITARKPPARG